MKLVTLFIEELFIEYDSETCFYLIYLCALYWQLDEIEKQLAASVHPDEEFLKKIAHACCKSFGATFLGIDVIIEKNTGRYAILDVNYFPLRCKYIHVNGNANVLIKLHVYTMFLAMEQFDNFYDVVLNFFRKACFP